MTLANNYVPKNDSYSIWECKTDGIKNISFPTSQFINLSFLEYTVFYNYRIFLVKILSLILDDLDKNLVYFY